MRQKIFLAVAAVSALLLSSCRKADEVTLSESQFDELEFTATIDGPVTKTTVKTDKDSQDRGKIEWIAGDEIKIKDAVGTEVTYVATNSGTTSIFRKAADQKDKLGSGPYTATYGTEPSRFQNYADHYKDATHARNVYMTAESETRSLPFKAACGLLKLTLTAISSEPDKTIRKIEVSGKVNDRDTTYTLLCDPAVSIEKDTSFYLTLPQGTYNEMKFYNTCLTCERHTENEGMAIWTNVIQPVTPDSLSFVSETIIGNADNTSVWWTAFSDYYTVREGYKAHITFKNYSDKTQNYHNWILVTNATGTERGGDGYSEFFVLRNDNWGWGKNYDESKRSSLYNWDTFMDDMYGSSVDMYLWNADGIIYMTSDITTKTGTVYKYSFNSTDTEARDFTFFFTVEMSHIENLNVKMEGIL